MIATRRWSGLFTFAKSCPFLVRHSFSVLGSRFSFWFGRTLRNLTALSKSRMYRVRLIPSQEHDRIWRYDSRVFSDSNGSHSQCQPWASVQARVWPSSVWVNPSTGSWIESSGQQQWIPRKTAQEHLKCESACTSSGVFPLPYHIGVNFEISEVSSETLDGSSKLHTKATRQISQMETKKEKMTAMTRQKMRVM